MTDVLQLLLKNFPFLSELPLLWLLNEIFRLLKYKLLQIRWLVRVIFQRSKALLCFAHNLVISRSRVIIPIMLGLHGCLL